MKSEQLKKIIYISIPESMQHSLGSLQLDPTILLPVEIPQGLKVEDWRPENLSWEMIISGMLKVLVYDENHKNRDYFREFVKTTRPEITAELTQSAVIKAQDGDFDLAEEIFKALIALDDTDLRSKLNLVLLYENKVKTMNSASLQDKEDLLNTIEEKYQDLLYQAEDLSDIYFNAAWFYYNRQDFKRAYDLSENYLSLGEDEIKRSEAEKLKRECSELKDTNDLYKEAYRLINEDKNLEGLRLITDFIDDNSQLWNAWFLQGWAFRKLSRFEEALESFKKALDIKGSQVDILNELAICYLELKQFGKSRKVLEEALGMDPENLKIISNMGILSLKENNREEAAGFFRTVLLLDPEDKMAAEYLDYIENS